MNTDDCQINDHTSEENNPLVRIETDGLLEPYTQYLTDESIPESLRNIARDVHNGNSSIKETVRDLLSWFGFKRRRYSVVETIRQDLNKLELEVVPDFNSTFIDNEIEFQPKSHQQSYVPESQEVNIIESDDVTISDSSPRLEVRQYVTGLIEDPTFRIGQLEAANKLPITVNPDADLKEATTLMIYHNYSQLPVIQSKREIKGILSWKSIGMNNALEKSCQKVRDCMDKDIQKVYPDSSLFSAIDLIVRHEYILVINRDLTLSGIVTTSDLSLQFRQLSEPFLLVGEIENYIRRLISDKFTTPELASVRDEKDERPINHIADLTIGEYLRLLENPKNWDRLNITADRSTFVKILDRVRILRNDIMHFDPDPFDEEDIEELRKFARLLRIFDEQLLE